jgi:hypothetical protein
MNELAERLPFLPAMSPRAVAAVRELESRQMHGEQVPITTAHLMHGGMYARTICIPADATLTGALLKVATVLVVHGACTVFIGDDEIHLSGFNVLAGSAGRKSAFHAHTDTHMTMVFPSTAQSVAEAEDQFTDEAALLMSRRDGSRDTITITGE